MENGKKYLKGFTLVELIIVITILAILATIAFLSFQSYTKSARDSDRMTTIKNIDNGINIFKTVSGKTPDIENISGTGILVGKELINVGSIGDITRRIINMNELPLDPLTRDKYVYGKTLDGKYYQIAAILETTQSYNIGIKKAYADVGLVAEVEGNYNGIMVYQSGTTCVSNIPSLIFNSGGIVDLRNEDIGYVVNKQGNLPYQLPTNPITTIKTTQEILKLISNTGAVTYECGIDTQTWSGIHNTIGTKLGYNVDKIGYEIFGDKYYMSIVSVNKTHQVNKSGPYSNCNSAGQVLEANSTYPGISEVGLSQPVHPACNKPDIIICAGSGSGYTISACNVGSNISGTGSESYGYYFQWGRNKGFTISDTTHYTSYISGSTGINASSDTYGFVKLASDFKNWTDENILNNWGNITNTDVSRQGPCANGYHIPSARPNVEWDNITRAGGWCEGQSCNEWYGGTLGETGYSNPNPLKMIEELKLPLGGVHAYNSNSEQGSAGYYWASSPLNSGGGYFLRVDSWWIDSMNNTSVASYGFNIRCVKNET